MIVLSAQKSTSYKSYGQKYKMQSQTAGCILKKYSMLNENITVSTATPETQTKLSPQQNLRCVYMETFSEALLLLFHMGKDPSWTLLWVLLTISS
ncbi:uncharacterized protein LOC129129144 isoform X3 [Agelaius phoeniceus]|uniref:uncharacterized protein LOC129129144 isoform X3 n=1 Tax=Agelaius phoeniceus TaxID=39638 RepID=UPI0040552D51